MKRVCQNSGGRTLNKNDTLVIGAFGSVMLATLQQDPDSDTRFFYKKLGSGHRTKSFLISHEILSILVLKVS